MAYMIQGLPKGEFAHLVGLDEVQLDAVGVRRIIADADNAYPCRVSLEDAEAGESLLLLNHVSHDVAGPYRAAFAIIVREGAEQAEPVVDDVPPAFVRRTLSLRAFDSQGDLVDSRVSLPGGHDGLIRDLLRDSRVDHLDAHHAGHGCFSARIERHKVAV